ncbi:MAG: hypothetical protein AB1486_13130 [Planctomycetota bacterium]
MDLSEIWQRHKPFLVPLAAALVIFLVGETIVGSIWGLESVRRDRDSYAAKLAGAKAVPRGAVPRLGADVQAYRERAEALCDQLAFRLGEEFVLPPVGSPQSHYIDVIDRYQRTLVHEPARRDISVPKDLGLPEMPSAERDEVQRTLRALNVIKQVVTYAVDARVNAIEEIEFKVRERRGARAQAAMVQPFEVTFELLGTGPSLACFGEMLATQPWRRGSNSGGEVVQRDSFLALLPGSRLEAAGEHGERVKGKFRIAALEIDRERALAPVEP